MIFKMIERNPLNYCLEAACDFCSADHESDIKDWHEFIREIKDEGWMILKDEDEWLHCCPACKED